MTRMPENKILCKWQINNNWLNRVRKYRKKILWESEVSKALVNFAKTLPIYRQNKDIVLKYAPSYTLDDYYDVLTFHYFDTRDFLIQEIWNKIKTQNKTSLKRLIRRLLEK